MTVSLTTPRIDAGIVSLTVGPAVSMIDARSEGSLTL